MPESTMHKGHRDRLKKRFLEYGLDSFTDIQVLELLLFYVIPRRDTNPIAHGLLDRFGSLAQVLEAPVSELEKVKGVGHEAAVFLSLIPAAGRFYMMDKANQSKALTTIEQCGQYLMPYFFGRSVETIFLLCLDAKCKVLCCKEIGEGSVNAAGISVRKIVETALAANATSVVLAHNHPSGIALPSPEDLQTTKRAATALRAVDIHLIDHIIVADEDYISLALSGQRFDDCLLI